MERKNKVVDISKKSFFSAVIVLLLFMVVATVLTFVLPKGKFAVGADGTVDYSNFVSLGKEGGINIFKAIFSPFLIFVSDGMLQPIMLSLFLVIIAGVFQSMLDCGGMQAIVSRLVNKFKDKRFAFICLLSLFFMCLGSFFGLFEETLILLPMVVTVCISLGYDAVTGFFVCMLSTGIGFSVALTNPFTVVYSSNIINASVTSGIWFRIICFALFYALVIGFIWLYVRRFNDAKIQTTESVEIVGTKKTFLIWTVFLLVALFCLILFTSLPFLRDLSTPLLAVVFLIGGGVAGSMSFGFKATAKSFGKGTLSALPAVVMIALAFSVKYILVEGNVLDTVTHYITTVVEGKNKYVTMLILFAIILLLEFFISSSTAKAVFVMGVLSGVVRSGALSISPELLVLIYVFSDGFTNMLFPTSPTLLIGLSMTGQSYTDWLKKSKFLFPLIFALCVALLMLAMAIGY